MQWDKRPKKEIYTKKKMIIIHERKERVVLWREKYRFQKIREHHAMRSWDRWKQLVERIRYGRTHGNTVVMATTTTEEEGEELVWESKEMKRKSYLTKKKKKKTLYEFISFSKYEWVVVNCGLAKISVEISTKDFLYQLVRLLYL